MKQMGVVFIASYEATEVLEPADRAFDLRVTASLRLCVKQIFVMPHRESSRPSLPAAPAAKKCT
jgi:hypothetical protein